MTKADLDSMKAWGFNAIRPALHYKWFTLPIQDEPVAGQQTWVNAGFDKLDELMGWAAANQMYVMFDMHGAQGDKVKIQISTTMMKPFQVYSKMRRIRINWKLFG